MGSFRAVKVQMWYSALRGVVEVRLAGAVLNGVAGRLRPPNLTFATICRFNPPIRFADTDETTSADRAARLSHESPEVNARQRVCALGRETVWGWALLVRQDVRCA